MKYLVGNWKSNKTFQQTYQWFDRFSEMYQPIPQMQVIVAVPYVFIPEAYKKVIELDLTSVAIAAQDISPFPLGAYTGAIAPSMIKDWVGFCIVGHSERRNYFAESPLEISKKIENLIQEKITPILCVDEPYAQKQLAALHPNDLEKIILAYEPLSAIGTGNPADPHKVQQVVKRLRRMLGTETVPILYGGSTKPENARDYLELDDVAGLLPGGSSLDPQVFSEMVKKFR